MVYITISSCLQRCCESPTISECDSMGTDGAGVSNADFVLYVSANSAGKCSQATATGGTLIAFAGHCQQEAALDRSCDVLCFVHHSCRSFNYLLFYHYMPECAYEVGMNVLHAIPTVGHSISYYSGTFVVVLWILVLVHLIFIKLLIFPGQ